MGDKHDTDIHFKKRFFSYFIRKEIKRYVQERKIWRINKTIIKIIHKNNYTTTFLGTLG